MLAGTAIGDEASFRELFDRYWDPVFRTALALTKSEALAEDLTQEIFLKIWLQRSKLTAVQRFKDYLFILSRNHIFNELRKKVRQAAFRDHLLQYYQSPGSSPEDQLLWKETEGIIDQAVEQLPPRQRMIYCLSRRQGMNQQEIARELHISTNTVKSHMNKALQSVNAYIRLHIELKIILIVFLERLL